MRVLSFCNTALPTGWEIRSLGEFVAERSMGIVPGKTPDAVFELYSVPSHESGRPEIISGKEIGSNKQTVEEGTVLLCKINPRINRTWVVASFSQHQKIASTEWITFPSSAAFDPKYLGYYLRQDSLREFLAANASGVGGSLMRVKPSTVRDYPFPLAPLNEQTRIVAEIEKQFSRLDEAVANLKRVKANLKRYKAAVLKAAVEGKLTEEWRNQHPDVEPADKLLERILAERRKAAVKGKYKEPVGPDTSGLPELPAEWVWASLGQLIDEPNYGTSKKCDYGAGAVGVLRIPNIANGVIDAEDLKLADFDVEEKRAYALKAGDILTIRSNGSVALVGKCALVRGQDTQFLYAGYLIRMRPSSEGVSSDYLMACLSSQMLRRQIEAKAKSTSGVNNINSGELQSLVVPLCSTREQQQIVSEVERRLSIVAGAEAQVDANLRRADRLRQSILKRAFTGKLVPQDPNDEPASVLLERIRSTQPAQTKAPAAHQRKHRAPAPKTGAPSTEPLPLVAEAPATYGDAIIARILATMQPGHEYARADLVELLGLTANQWNAAIQELKRVGKVRQVGEKRGAKYLL